MTERSLAGRNVFVLGASSGIGRGVALAAAGAGANIAVVGRRGQLLDKLIATTGRGTAVVADLSDPDECGRAAAEGVRALGGRVDAVLHATGTSPLMPIARTDAEMWQTVMATNVIGPALVTKAVLPALAEDGIVSFLSSRAVGHPYQGMGAYAASKAALDHTLLSWRLENPGHRFLRIEVGDTSNTDFARDFELEVIAEVFPQWVSHAVMTEKRMDAEDLGALIAKVLGQCLNHPEIAMHNLVLHPVGGPRIGGQEELVAGMQAALAAKRAAAAAD
jgi:NAD(P)-dependent dehydrogenase (short-subunit alcohol dehydrogenase family)